MLKGQRGVLCFVAFYLCGCIPPGDTKLSIPYRAQEQYNYCVPASVLMWRLYDGLPAVSQTSIFNWMGGAGCVNQNSTTAAVKHFTRAYDAYWDKGRSSDYKGMVARQVTAFDRQTPSLAVVYGNHVVVVTGGKYHTEGSLRIWDYVRVHDPNPYYGSHVRWSAGDWLNLFCGAGQTYCDQIVSQISVDGWYQNVELYADGVRVYGWDRDTGPIDY